jgi:hypothetical protein
MRGIIDQFEWPKGRVGIVCVRTILEESNISRLRAFATVE